MYKVLYLPLDDRPCNEHFPYLLPRKDYEIIPLPDGMMGNIKQPANFDMVSLFLKNNATICKFFVISLDTLIYGGLIPSRLHHSTKEELLKRVNTLLEIKKLNKDLKIYAFSTLMRCPNTNFNSEEPEYWTNYGKKIFRYGQLKDLESLNKITDEELKEFAQLKKDIPQEIINDFMDRREINLSVTKELIKLNEEKHIFEFYCLPQDDSHAIGWTAMDQREINYYFELNSFNKLNIYPGADEVGMVVLSRAISEAKERKVNVFVKYPNEETPKIVPPYEDRMISKTIESQLNVSGVNKAASEELADVIIYICLGYFDYLELINYAKHWKSNGKIFGIVDTLYPSGSDEKLIAALKENNMLLEIDGYASWNTASNSFGTVLASTILYFLEKDTNGNKKFLIHRYIDDYAYCTSVRGWTDVNAALARGYCEAVLDGVDGTCTQMCHDELLRFVSEKIPDVSTYIKDIKVTSPWNRSFEMKFVIEYNHLK